MRGRDVGGDALRVRAGAGHFDVGLADVFGWLADGLEDLREGDAIEEHLIELVAKDFREAGDFAVAGMGVRGLGVLLSGSGF